MSTFHYFYGPPLAAKTDFLAAKTDFLAAKTDFLAASLNLDSDKFDNFGRNQSAQQRRQKLVPWVLVDRQRTPTPKSPSQPRDLIDILDW